MPLGNNLDSIRILNLLFSTYYATYLISAKFSYRDSTCRTFNHCCFNSTKYLFEKPNSNDSRPLDRRYISSNSRLLFERHSSNSRSIYRRNISSNSRSIYRRNISNNTCSLYKRPNHSNRSCSTSRIEFSKYIVNIS